LEIKSAWKNLQGLVVDFDKREPVTALIGRNGSAKSNLLEAIIYVFRNLDLNEPAEFSYQIKYWRVKRSLSDVQTEGVRIAATGWADFSGQEFLEGSVCG